MKVQISFIILFAALLSHRASAQSISCTPQHVTFASNSGSHFEVEKTSVTWERIDYQINGNTATVRTYKNIDDPPANDSTEGQNDLIVIDNTLDKVVLMGGKFGFPMWVTMDVIFPKEGNGYSFYASDHPKTINPEGPGMVNLSKLYMLKCKVVSE